MPDQNAISNAVPTASDVRRALRYLARKGAYAVQASDDAAASFAIHVEDEGGGAGVGSCRDRGASPQPRLVGKGSSGPPASRLGRPQGAAQGAQSPDGGRHRAAQEIRTERQGEQGLPAAKPSTHALQDTPLAWLRRRKDKDGQPLITDAQFTAGERLATDYRRAHITRRITSDWSGVAASRQSRRGAPDAGVELSDAAVAARERLKRAIAAVGSELAGILIDVCCHETGLEAAERAEGWPQRAAKVVLQLALTSLARHYGLIAPERTPFARLRHWGDEDYRPGLDAWR